MYKITLFSLCIFGLVGCQSQPIQPTEKPQIKSPEISKPSEIRTPTGVVIKPYDREEIQRQQLPKPQQKASPNVVIPYQQPKQSFNDGSELPAFKNLIQQAESALQHNQLGNAESLTLQAQRLAPQSAQTYLILSKISLAKKDKTNARALANRGLSFAQTESIKQQLTQIMQQTN